MATEAQINANRENAKHSTGPVTPEGRATAAQNPVIHGLFAKRDFVRPGEVDLYNAIAAALKDELDPGSLLESIHFAEALTATWRLHRCAKLEADLAEQAQVDPQFDPMLDSEHRKLQQSIDRARVQAHNLLMKATKEIARLKKTQTSPSARETETTDGIRARLAALHAASSEKTEQTQSTPPISEQTQSKSHATSPNSPRNAPCPCNSGQKFKRCCGFDPKGLFAKAA